jgi:hypothetical protein
MEKLTVGSSVGLARFSGYYYESILNSHDMLIYKAILGLRPIFKKKNNFFILFFKKDNMDTQTLSSPPASPQQQQQARS